MSFVALAVGSLDGRRGMRAAGLGPDEVLVAIAADCWRSPSLKED